MNKFVITIGPKLSKNWDKYMWTYHSIFSNNEIANITTNEIEVANYVWKLIPLNHLQLRDLVLEF